ncbi:MAG: type II toxin-antitoxin system RelB/DinJ family antitoxin [Ruminiclostridium sp.]|nr:type II toxin-antitoxin system RelB/DinJ family antitoxin [Ruminiclostridium sp.]
MTETTNLDILVNRDLKERAEQVFEDMGMDLSTAFNLFMRQTLRQGKIPFEIYADPFYSDSNMRALERSIEQERKGKVVVKTMEELERMADGE